MKMVNVEPYVDVESSRAYIDGLFSPDSQTCLDAVIHLKNSVIGSNKQKGIVIQMGVLPRLFQILLDKNSSNELMVETAVTLGSLARGTDKHVEELLNAGLLNVILRGLASTHQKLMEACLRCMRTVLSRKESPVEVLYNDPTLVPHLVRLAKQPSATVQECVMTMLYSGCQTAEHQDILCENGVLELLAPMLCCSIYRVQIPSLRCLAQMCYQNEKVSELAATSSFGGRSVPDILISLMSRDRTTEMQLVSAKCMTYMFRAGALSADDSRIIYKALPTLVRMCQKDVAPEERVEGAETLAYLTEVDTELQRIASISDHLIPTLSELLKFRTPVQNGTDVNDDIANGDEIKIDVVPKAVQEVKMAQEMKQAAFKAFSSLAANDEEIRKKIIDTDTLMENVVGAFSDPNPRVRLAAVRCLHSLSRSVQQLRTTFQDHAVGDPLMKLLHNANDDILTVASSTLCNLLLEFSPSKEPILECGAVELLCGLTRREDPSLRLNGVWALMNMAFQADHKIKAQILTALGSEHVFRLLSDSDVDVLMKTLGLLRNLLSTKPHIDHIMGLHGKQVMQAIVLILESDHNAEVKEQALCILANIADGDFAKNFIMSNEDVLKKLTTYMMHSNVKLQIAATFCISNLVWKEEEGALERQAKLKDLGVQQLLQQLLSTSDTTLFDRVKTALHQFPSQGT
ncbi:LOW QUALITY PROTEIN: armadillo repeat-containing protein 8-like [Uloborus diversus]|uniref:LOW QUALITY PROTEIN: armadillo repeat-containing protein 8-like n=1 Tax=Uloborus diversus TaxID=327109 RepID=UPI0024096C5D|nr:LOW QUALITY PROTEIN: armadillo repeat-containing protein 8-like [Uloborus diversus]